MRRLLLLVLVCALCVPALADAGSKPRKRTAAGTVTSSSSSSVTVTVTGASGDATVTCALADGMTAPGVGARVRIACRTADGGKLVLVSLERLEQKSDTKRSDAPKPPEAMDPTPPVQTQAGEQRDARGTVTTLADGVLTVTRPDGGSLTCSVTPAQLASLRLAFQLGSRMLVFCRIDGTRLLFVSAARLEEPAPTTPAPATPPPTTPAPATRDARGVVAALSADAVTVRPDAGGDSLRCRITRAADSTAATAKLSLGAHVLVVCRRDGSDYVLSGATPLG
jgi:hypothetical protein